MNRSILFLISILMLFSIELSAQKKKTNKTDEVITLSTEFGDMVIILYDKTPKHKNNFIKLAKEGFYNDLLFHRVIKDFMIQGGDPNSKNAKPDQMLGDGDVGYRIDAEFDQNLFHKKGTIAAARDGNPQKASSGCQFYIVQGTTYSDEKLDYIEERTKKMQDTDLKFTETQRKVYHTLGGTPFLDQNYTVFGEVIQGLELIDKIAAQETNSSDRPIKDIAMKVSVKTMKKKKIKKMYGYDYPKNQSDSTK